MEDNLAELLLPDVLASNTYWGHFRRKTSLHPEEGLMLAVLEDAVRCVRNHPQNSKSKVRREALEWILDDQSDDVFSYETICGLLGIDAAWLRRGILSSQGTSAEDRAGDQARRKPSKSPVGSGASVPRREGPSLKAGERTKVKRTAA